MPAVMHVSGFQYCQLLLLQAVSLDIAVDMVVHARACEVAGVESLMYISTSQPGKSDVRFWRGLPLGRCPCYVCRHTPQLHQCGLLLDKLLVNAWVDLAVMFAGCRPVGHATCRAMLPHFTWKRMSHVRASPE